MLGPILLRLFHHAFYSLFVVRQKWRLGYRPVVYVIWRWNFDLSGEAGCAETANKCNEISAPFHIKMPRPVYLVGWFVFVFLVLALPVLVAESR